MSDTLFSTYKDALGVLHSDEPVAIYENGKVYLAADGILGTVAKGSQIGEYENGFIYNVSGLGNRRSNLIAIFENGHIYGISSGIMGGYVKSLSLGECYHGTVYSAKSGAIGNYTGNDEGAAAACALVLMKLSSNVSAYEATKDSSYRESSSRSQYHSDSHYSSQPSPGSGLMTFIFIFGLFILCLAGMLIYQYRTYLSLFLYIVIPLVLLLIKLIRIIILKKDVEITLVGLLKALAINFVYTLVTVGVFQSLLRSEQLVHIDLAILMGFIFAGIRGIIKKP